MKTCLKWPLQTLLWLLLASTAHAQGPELQYHEISAWPKSPEEFTELQRQWGHSTNGSAALLLVAFHVYTENPKLGEQLLTLIVHPELLVPSDAGYKGYALRASDLQLLKLQLRPRTANSYIVNTLAENDYALKPTGPWRIAFQPNDNFANDNPSRYKVFVVSSGADAPRPILLHKEPSNAHGLWYVQDWSALLMPVR
jgi:hypothetical protein